MSLYVLIFTALLLLPLVSSSLLLNLSIVSLTAFMVLVSNYSFGLFMGYTLNSSLFFLDEYGNTLSVMMVLVVYFSLLSYLSDNHESKGKTLLLTLLITLMLLASVLVFMSSSLFFMYLGYELSLIPIVLIILIWGTYPERSASAMMMLFYTLMFSLPLMMVLTYLLVTSSFSSTALLVFSPSCPLPDLGLIIPLMVFLAFAVKLPIYGLHSWLPMAHVEAPTFGSMLLAGLLLKLGGCGLYRFSISLPGLFTNLSPYLLSFLLVGMFLSGLICSLQSDLKRLIAYSSVVHMTSVGLIYVLDSTLATSASLILLTLHGVSSPLMFYMVGQLSSNSGTRNIMLLRGMKYSLPLLYLGMIMTFYLTVPIPPCLSFLGELFLFTSLLKMSYLVALLLGLYLFVSVLFNLLWLSVFFGRSLPNSAMQSSSVLSGYIPVWMGLLGLSFIFMHSSMFT